MPIEPDDICFNKAAIMERSLGRALEEFAADPALKSFTHIDALTLNIERACQAAIDLAMHIVSSRHIGMPQTSSDAFRLLSDAGLIEKSTAGDMIAMAGFRNVVVHEYQALDMAILRNIAEERWRSMVMYCRELGIRIEPHIPHDGRGNTNS